MASERQLNNADFRRLLMTPRAADGTGTGAGAASSAARFVPATKTLAELLPGARARRERHGGHDAASAAAPSAAPRTPAKGAAGTAAAAEGPARYRDRAQERREGRNPDFADADVLMQSLARGADDERGVLEGDGAGADGADAAGGAVAVDRTKFLGGDLMHTHLVRGLDYALLQRTRDQPAQHAAVEDAARRTDARAGDRDAGAGTATVRAAEHDAVRTETHPVADSHAVDDGAPVTFHTLLARRIHELLCGKQQQQQQHHGEPQRPNELFLPGRMAYVFDLSDAQSTVVDPSRPSHFELPTCVIRSRSDTPSAAALLELATHNIVVAKLRQIWYERRKGSREAGRRTAGGTESAAAVAAAAAAPPARSATRPPASSPKAGVDIFEDAGRDYVCDASVAKERRADAVVVTDRRPDASDAASATGAPSDSVTGPYPTLQSVRATGATVRDDDKQEEEEEEDEQLDRILQRSRVGRAPTHPPAPKAAVAAVQPTPPESSSAEMNAALGLLRVAAGVGKRPLADALGDDDVIDIDDAAIAAKAEYDPGYDYDSDEGDEGGKRRRKSRADKLNHDYQRVELIIKERRERCVGVCAATMRSCCSREAACAGPRATPGAGSRAVPSRTVATTRMAMTRSGLGTWATRARRRCCCCTARCRAAECTCGNARDKAGRPGPSTGRE